MHSTRTPHLLGWFLNWGVKEEEAPLLIWRAIGIYDQKVEKKWREERYDEM